MHVVIAGGGVAGLEALLALSVLAKGLVDVELVSPTDEFVYRPLLVAEPFGNADVLRIEHRTEGEMRDHLSALDKGMDHLIALSRHSEVLKGPTTSG